MGFVIFTRLLRRKSSLVKKLNATALTEFVALCEVTESENFIGRKRVTLLARFMLTLREGCYLGGEHHGGAVKAGPNAVKGLSERETKRRTKVQC